MPQFVPRLLVTLAVVAGTHTRTQVHAATDDCKRVALVTRVFDGDTVDVVGVGRVRLIGIDAPEIGGRFERPAPFALEARDGLQGPVLQRWVRLECDRVMRDDYGRRLAYIFLETGEFVNARLIEKGLARVLARTHLRYWNELRRAEDRARADRRGISGGWPRMPPQSFTLPRPNQ